jgi:hypothetical protein
MVEVDPMITVRTKRSPFEARADQVMRVEWRGQSVLDLARDHWRQEWGEHTFVAALVNGRRVDRADLGLPLADDLEVTIGPEPQGAVIGYIAILVGSALLSAGVSWAYSKLVGVPKPELPQERGEDASKVYAWDQIHSEYRAGFPVPLLFGEHDIGPQVVYTSVEPPGTGSFGPYEVLRVILVLCEGRIHSIGGVVGNAFGEADALGGFLGQGGTPGAAIPTDIRIDGNRFDSLAGEPGVRAYVRLGAVQQGPLPATAFPGTTQTDSVNGELRGAWQRVIHTIIDPELKSTLGLLIFFPSGLYSLDSNGNFVSVVSGHPTSTNGVWLQMAWRPAGTSGAWQALGEAILDVPPSQTPFVRKVTVDLTGNGSRPGIAGDMELRVIRRTNAPNENGQSDRDVSSCVWRQVTYRLDQEFAYPRTALLGLEVQATEQLTAGRPNFVVRAKGQLVRVWDAVINSGNPSEGRYWELPEAGDPYHGIWSYPPGRNPAWIAVEFLLHKASLGPWLGETDIDWQAFRNWADFCDQDAPVDAVNEALCCFDGVIDAPGAAWDHLMRICKAGRAVPVIKGSQVSVKYVFAAAHGRGTNVVPAKTRVALLSSTNVQGLTFEYSNVQDRPAVIQAQFLDEAEDYAQTLIPVDDPDGGHEEPSALNPLGYTKETVQLYGITRRSQVVREVLLMHRANRRITTEASCEVGPDQLGAELGDVVGIQHDIYRPNGGQSFAARAIVAGSAATSIQLNRPVEVTASTYVVFRDANDACQEVAIVSAPGSYAAGDALTLGAAHSWRIDTPVAIGQQDKIVVDFEISNITLNDSLTRKVSAVRWVPGIHAIEDVGPYVDTGTGGARVGSEFDARYDGSQDQVGSILVRPSPTRRGSYTIGWETPNGYEGRKVRVFARPTGAATWWALGEFRTSPCEWTFSPGESYEVAVALASRLGIYQVPDVAATSTFIADEFPGAPPPNVRGAAASYLGDHEEIELRWDSIEASEVVAYEVRKGRRLNGSELVGYVREPLLRTSRVEVYDAGDTLRFWVRAHSSTGLFSPVPAKVDTTAVLPLRLTTLDDVEVQLSSVTTSALALAQDILTLRWSAQLLTGAYRGYIESAVESVGYDVQTLTMLHVGMGWSEDPTIGELAAIRLGSGEAFWWLLNGRPASLFQRGMNVEERVGDFPVLIGSISGDRTVGGYRGQAGQRAALVVSYRIAKTADVGTISSQPWVRYTGPFSAEFDAIQVRVEVLRSDLGVSVNVNDLRITRYA